MNIFESNLKKILSKLIRKLFIRVINSLTYFICLIELFNFFEVHRERKLGKP